MDPCSQVYINRIVKTILKIWKTQEPIQNFPGNLNPYNTQTQ